MSSGGATRVKRAKRLMKAATSASGKCLKNGKQNSIKSIYNLIFLI